MKGGYKPGPSEDYLRMLRGEITPKEYARALKRRVRRERKERRFRGTA